ncbi:ATP-binding protein [Thalassotalea maritima]|uniref:ATP-binding protein n=1 Tax=Thalassotalea maritima TaxID=3242416 RepID=UPI003528BC51
MTFEQRLARINDTQVGEDAQQAFLQLLANGQLSSQQKGQVYRAIALNWHQSGQLSKALHFAQLGKQFAKQMHEFEMQAQFAKLMGIIYYYQSENAKAVVHYEQALAYYLQTNKRIDVAHLYNNLGLAYDRLGRVNSAFNSFLNAKSIYDDIGSELDKNDISFNLAGLYITLKRYDKAIELLIPVIEERERLQLYDDAALAYNHLGLAYKHTGQYQLAEQYHLKNLSYYREQKHYFHTASQLNNLADLYVAMGRIEQARGYVEQCLPSAQKSENNQAYANCLYLQAKVFYHDGETQQAIENAIRAAQLFEQLSDVTMQAITKNLLPVLYAGAGNRQQAMESYQNAKEGLAELLKADFSKQLSSYESEQLHHQINELKHQQKIAQLNQTKMQQHRNFVLVLVGFLLLFGFMAYRKSRDNKYRYSLEQLVQERTQELQATMEQLSEANAIKSQFLANMTHEIRTPLTAIIGQAEAIRYGEVNDDEILDEVDVIYSNSKHLLQLINDILDLSKIEANKLQIAPEATDISLICSDLLNIFSGQAKQKRLELVIDNNLPSPCIVAIDYLRFSQIIINLCGNAIKFTHQGQVKVSISLNNEQLLVSIEDTGIGMSQEQLQRVFDSFSQADSSINRRFGGTGLGLFLSSQLAQLMQGNICVHSELGQGSCFTFAMPAKLLSTEHHQLQDANISSLIDTPLQGRVLVAEDHLDNLRFISRMLTAMGLTVFPASHGAQVLDIIAEQEIDLLLLDIQMPHMDGLQVLDKLRNDGFYKPIVALTANTMAHDVKMYLQRGFDEHIKKPIDRTAFVRSVAKYFVATANVDNHNIVATDKASNESLSVKGQTNTGIALELPLITNMDDLVDSFANKLADNHQQISELLALKNWQQLRHEVHQLAGAAAVFGYPTLSEFAAIVDRALAQQPVDADYIEQLSLALLLELEQLQTAQLEE